MQIGHNIGVGLGGEAGNAGGNASSSSEVGRGPAGVPAKEERGTGGAKGTGAGARHAERHIPQPHIKTIVLSIVHKESGQLLGRSGRHGWLLQLKDGGSSGRGGGSDRSCCRRSSCHSTEALVAGEETGNAGRSNELIGVDGGSIGGAMGTMGSNRSGAVQIAYVGADLLPQIQ